MATKKVKAEDRVRHIERTREKLFAGVEGLLARRDYKNLNPATLAAIAGMGKNIVYDTFGSMTALLEAYIAKVDHWKPFFERFALPKQATASQVRQMFGLLMQDNFKRFHASKAMQDLILWQLAGDRPLLRTVSENREREGDKLLRLSDGHFRKSGISFRAVMALLLEGCYGLVLHAGNNASSVCGIDINNERDWQLVYRSLSEMIDCIWERAASISENPKNYRKTKAAIVMNYELVYLEELATRLASVKNSADTAPDEELLNESKKVERVLLSHVLNAENETQIRMRLQVNLQTVVSVCDLLYDSGRNENANAEVILQLLEGLRLHLNLYIPGSLSVPHLFRDRKNMEFQTAWSIMQEQLSAAGIDARLIVLTGIPFERFANPQERLEWDDFKYMRKYCRRLQYTLSSPGLSVQLVLDTLVGLGFNDAAFLMYCFERMRLSLDGLKDPDINVLLRNYRRRVQQVIQFTNMRYDHYKKPVMDELIKWLDAELGFYTKGSSI